ncbi:MAG: copper chaperone PCu(A)C [Erythrobacter sp.]
MERFAIGSKALLGASLAGVLMIASACSGGTDQAAPAATAPGVVEGIAISNARLVLNPVKTNPAAVYFDVAYSGDKGLSIRKAEVEGAGMSMMHDYVEYDYKMQMTDALPVALTKGTEVSFKPGGLHVMAMEPSPDWEPGGKVKVTLTMSGGATHVFEAEIMAPGSER